MPFQCPAVDDHVQMWMWPVNVKGGNVVECTTVSTRTEHIFHPRAARSVRSTVIGILRKTHDNMRSQVLVAFCVWLAGLIITGLLGPTARQFIKAIVLQYEALMALGALEINRTLARQIFQLPSDLSRSTRATARHNSDKGLRMGHSSHLLPHGSL